MNEIKNVVALTKDLLEGEEKVYNREDFQILSPFEIKQALRIITENKSFSDTTKKYLLTNTWRVNYKVKPPTIEEFLTPEWLGDTANALYPYIKHSLIDMFDPSKNYKNLILFWPIGSGKSFLTTIINLYIATIIYMMRNPKKTLGLNASAIMCNVFLAFSLDKATEVLLAPFKEIMMVSPKFEKCRTIEQMYSKEKECGTDKICWTTASAASALSFGSNMSFKVKSSVSSILGLTILCGSVTELAFFKDAGFSDEEIMRLYNDLKGRIFSRFPNAFWAKSILDSSPNDASFPQSIDYFILNEAPKNPDNLILRGTKWGLQPWHFPEWQANKTKLFWVFKGGKEGKLPKVIENENEVKQYNENDIIECPIDAIQLAKDDTGKFIKDYCGEPSGASNRLIYDNTRIEAIFVPHLNNIYSHIVALESEQPEGLIWNKIQDEFFIQISPGHFEFYRNPLEERFVSVDQSITGDTAAIGVTHPEMNEAGEIIDIVDMTICIIPNKFRINLDAIKFVIYDLKFVGNMNIKHVSFDQFQSESAQQYLRRAEFDVEHLSVDSTTAPYLNFVQQINLGRVKAGRNIYMKNNLKSIKMSKTPTGKPKIDHELGKVENSITANTDWKTSSLGFNAKDSTDAVCASIELRKKYFVGIPRYVYSDYIDVIEEGKTIQKAPKVLNKLGLKLR